MTEKNKEKSKNTEKKQLTPKEVEEIYGISTGTLANWRSKKKGLPYIKDGRIYYDIEDLDEYFKNKKVYPGKKKNKKK